MLVIIDYGMGNLRSIQNKIQRIEKDVKISSKIEDIECADKLILPGVGSFAVGMENIKSFDLLTVLNRKVIKERTPILGICLGMQLFTSSSEEGHAEGLGWIRAKTIRFHNDEKNKEIKIPHMGFNSIKIIKSSRLLDQISDGSPFYFVHSYHVVCEEESDIVATTLYGYNFSSVIEAGNIDGVQFHPEKSHDAGFQLLKNFINMV
jgi:imidazole glycerol-phosphate synthase subunit HisH